MRSKDYCSLNRKFYFLDRRKLVGVKGFVYFKSEKSDLKIRDRRETGVVDVREWKLSLSSRTV